MLPFHVPPHMPQPQLLPKTKPCPNCPRNPTPRFCPRIQTGRRMSLQSGRRPGFSMRGVQTTHSPPAPPEPPPIPHPPPSVQQAPGKLRPTARRGGTVPATQQAHKSHGKPFHTTHIISFACLPFFLNSLNVNCNSAFPVPHSPQCQLYLCFFFKPVAVRSNTALRRRGFGTVS